METFDEKAERLKKESEEIGSYEEIHKEIWNAHYFDEHNEEISERHKNFNKKLKFANFQKIKEEIEDKNFLRNYRKNKKIKKDSSNCLKTKDWFYEFTNGKPIFKIYSEVAEKEQDKYIEFWMDMHKNFA